MSPIICHPSVAAGFLFGSFGSAPLQPRDGVSRVVHERPLLLPTAPECQRTLVGCLGHLPKRVKE